MKRFVVFIALLLCLNCDETYESLQPAKDFKALTADFQSWWAYHYNSINLARDFIPIDENFEDLTKLDFLKKLETGDYIVIELYSESPRSYYKLYKLPKHIDRSITQTIKSRAYIAIKHFKMEQQAFPDFNALDLNGARYNNDALMNNITVVKTWFIGCKACVAEFPELNDLVDKYRNQKHIQFISLALNQKAELMAFINEKPFHYAILADQKKLIQKDLKLREYPTHLVIGENGEILKVFEKASQMIEYLENYMAKRAS